MATPERCAACSSAEGLGTLDVAGRALVLCGAHRAEVAGAPQPFEDVAALFAFLGAERRRGERRRRERRQFPPRPEGRRHGTDRRAG